LLISAGLQGVLQKRPSTACNGLLNSHDDGLPLAGEPVLRTNPLTGFRQFTHMKSAETDVASVDSINLHAMATVSASDACRPVSIRGPRIALITPYTGGNLGDAAIQDAIIANLRIRLPGAVFAGLSLNSENFLNRHGSGAFPLCASHWGFYRMYSGKLALEAVGSENPNAPFRGKRWSLRILKDELKKVPVLGALLTVIYSVGKNVGGEIVHCVRGYRFLGSQDLLIVSGGGQLDEEWGGAWGHPFALFKWALLARIARVPYVIASVGACKIDSRISRFFLSTVLRLAQYRSYRDKNSNKVAAGLLARAVGDPVVPDIAFSTLTSELSQCSRPAGSWLIAEARRIVAISLIAYAKPGRWPRANAALHDRYLEQMAKLVSHLLRHDYAVVLVWSSLGDDESVIPELLGRLDEASRNKLALQMHIPKISTWKDLVVTLHAVDFLIASRLHSVILGFLARIPTIAISFDPKVDWVMEDVGQTEYLLQIHDFTAERVLEALDFISLRREVAVGKIESYLQQILSSFEQQYDRLANLALAS
jgi:polysaccharide pyruvyl transferase WcaK-like protein